MCQRKHRPNGIAFGETSAPGAFPHQTRTVLTDRGVHRLSPVLRYLSHSTVGAMSFIIDRACHCCSLHHTHCSAWDLATGFHLKVLRISLLDARPSQALKARHALLKPQLFLQGARCSRQHLVEHVVVSLTFGMLHDPSLLQKVVLDLEQEGHGFVTLNSIQIRMIATSRVREIQYIVRAMRSEGTTRVPRGASSKLRR